MNMQLSAATGQTTGAGCGDAAEAEPEGMF